MNDVWLKKLPKPAQTYLEDRRLDEVECIISDLPGIARMVYQPQLHNWP